MMMNTNTNTSASASASACANASSIMMANAPTPKTSLRSRKSSIMAMKMHGHGDGHGHGHGPSVSPTTSALSAFLVDIVASLEHHNSQIRNQLQHQLQLAEEEMKDARDSTSRYSVYVAATTAATTASPPSPPRIQILCDNARVLASEHCCTPRTTRPLTSRPLLTNMYHDYDYDLYYDHDLYENGNMDGVVPLPYRVSGSPPMYEQQKQRQKGTARWESSTDVSAKPPLRKSALRRSASEGNAHGLPKTPRRRVYCEPEKLAGQYPGPAGRRSSTSMMPLTQLARHFHHSSATNTNGVGALLQTQRQEQPSSLDSNHRRSTSSSSVDMLTTELLDQALDLLSDVPSSSLGGPRSSPALGCSKDDRVEQV